MILSDVLAMLASFGESCTYLPKGGPARTLAAIVDEDGTYSDMPRGIASVETVRILVLRDKEHASFGGIDDPQLGDGLRLNRYPAAKVYSYEGEKSDVDLFAWTLKFTRPLPHTIGGNRHR